MFVSPFRSFETIPHETAPTLNGLDGGRQRGFSPSPSSPSHPPQGVGVPAYDMRRSATVARKPPPSELLYLRGPHENCSPRRGDMNKPPPQHPPALQTDRHQQDNKTKTPSPSHPTPSLAPPPRTRTARLVARQPRPTEPGPHPDRQKPRDRAARRRWLHKW